MVCCGFDLVYGWFELGGFGFELVRGFCNAGLRVHRANGFGKQATQAFFGERYELREFLISPADLRWPMVRVRKYTL
eukprot:1911141-Alexandrium_andersonii.AAC.1